MAGSGELRRKAVVWIQKGDEGYGVAATVATAALALRRRGWQVHPLALGPGVFVDELRLRGFETKVLGLAMPELFSPRLTTALRLLRPQARIEAAALAALQGVQAGMVRTTWLDLVPLAGAVAKSLRAPAFWDMANVLSDSPGTKQMALWSLRRWAVRPVANSAYTASTLKGIDAPVIPLSADGGHYRRRLSRRTARRRLGLPPGATVLCLCARLVASKGGEQLLRAAASIHGDYLHLLYAGGPLETTYASRLSALAAREGLAGRFHLLGPVADVRLVYEASDFSVQAYQGAESFGLSVLEAMLMGVPVLAHRRGGPGELLRDGRDGWLLPGAAAGDLRAGLDRALADRGRWARMGSSARSRALRGFTPSVQARRMEEALKLAVGL
jgi:glycosyltransferase involved in cell wall biosynthesis